MKVANGVEMLVLPANLANGPTIIHPTIIWGEDNMILVDAGLPGQLTQIRDSFQSAGLTFEKLNKIIITHSDMDHIGGLSTILNELDERIEVLAHNDEKPYIECELQPIRLTQIGAQLKFLKGEQHLQMKILYENLKANYNKFRVNVDRTVTDGEELPFCGGIKILFTPGHTPGHICLYLEESKTLVAGDLLNVDDERLVPSPDFTIVDKSSAMQSLQKLTQYDIQAVICYHGGLYTGDVNHRILELVNK
ncbi:metal-dependent hydrolase [hydrocarbon metagenome]|uniref:Metal-dependent hydrolase n=1 Tax=hydrocarbon metagenome TaxID=938273 RepID=A0A0W8E884_9ZZZZ